MSLSPDEAARLAQAGYSIEGEIGRGGSGVVYLAHQELLDRQVALKRVGLDAAADVGNRRRLDAEVAALIALEHPGVIRLMDVLRYPEAVWFVTEYVAGPTLRRILDLSGGVSHADSVGLVGQLAEVLDYLATRGVVHRDLKPANVFVTPDGRVKLGDLGIALTGTDARLTRPGVVVGTLSYLSPEQASGHGDPSPASDRYSLGVMAYELMTGRVPFMYGGNVLALLTAHVSEPPADPRSLRPQIPEGVAEVLLLPLAKDPDARPATAQEYRLRLEGAADVGWPGWRQAVDIAALAHRFGPGPATGPKTTEEDAATAAWEPATRSHPPEPPSPEDPASPSDPVQPPQLVRSTRQATALRLRPARRRGPGWAPAAAVFVVAVVGSFLAVRSVVSDGGGLRVTSLQLSCSQAAATARLQTNGRQGEVRYRWSSGGPGVVRVGNQSTVTLTDRGGRSTGGPAPSKVIFYLTSPGARSASCLTGGRSSTG